MHLPQAAPPQVVTAAHAFRRTSRTARPVQAFASDGESEGGLAPEMGEARIIVVTSGKVRAGGCR